MNVWGWVLAVHVLCAVIWVGGMFFAYVVLRPSLSVLEPIQRIALHTQIFRRFFQIKMRGRRNADGEVPDRRLSHRRRCFLEVGALLQGTTARL